MKIIEAEVVATEDNRYEGKVVLEDEGVRYIGKYIKPKPDEALHCAMAQAHEQVTDKLHKSLSIGLSVSF